VSWSTVSYKKNGPNNDESPIAIYTACVQREGWERKGEGVKSMDAVLQDIRLQAQDPPVFRRDDENPGPTYVAQVLEHGMELERRDASRCSSRCQGRASQAERQADGFQAGLCPVCLLQTGRLLFGKLIKPYFLNHRK
jgi:hypothetical protein